MKASFKPLQGTITALVTPFREGSVDLPALEKLVERQLEAGVDGLVPCGTTGEASALSMAEHRPVVSLVSKLARRKATVLAGAGVNSTAETLELVRINEDCGADALLIVTPYYNRPSQDGLYRHYETIAQATELPIVLYNIPARTGVTLSIETIKRLFDDFENIVAIKHATEDVMDAADLAAVCEIPILCGDDPLALPLMAQGAVGTISTLANLVPRAVKQMTDAMLAGDVATARAVHQRLYPTARALLSLETNPMPVKTALSLAGWCTEEFRLPLCELNAEQKKQLQELLANLELE